MRIRTYREMMREDTFEGRFDYLMLKGEVGHATFGYDRWMNQGFYTSSEWRNLRHAVIARDSGLDLGAEGYEIYDKVYVHHMNPMTPEDIERGNGDILNLDYLITTSHRTHNAIHFGNRDLLRKPMVERRPGDTKLW